MMSYTRGYSIPRIGALVVLGSCIFLAAFAYMTDRTIDHSASDLYVRVATAEGLKNGDAVLLRGVQVGVVKGIRFSDDDRVLVRARLRQHVPLTRASHAALVAADMFGRQSLVLKMGEPDDRMLSNGDTIDATPPASLTGEIAGLSRSAGRIVSDTTALLLRDALSGIAQATAQIAALASNTNAAVTRIGAPVSLQPIQTQIEATAAHVNDMSLQLDSTAVILRQVALQLQHGNGTAARLLNDDTMYIRVNAALASLEDLLTDVRKNPKRYINVKVF